MMTAGAYLKFNPLLNTIFTDYNWHSKASDPGTDLLYIPENLFFQGFVVFMVSLLLANVAIYEDMKKYLVVRSSRL